MSNCIKPSTHIGAEEADNRVQLYLDNKMPILSACIEYKNELRYITYKPKGFQNLLRILNDVPYYDGIRIYFASYLYNPFDPEGNALIPGQPDNPNDDCTDHLALIFVPTTLEEQEQENGDIKYIHRDDINNCWIIKGEEVKKLKSPPTSGGNPRRDTASSWIGYYQALKLPKLTKNGQMLTGNVKYGDAKSIWYGKKDWGHRDDNKGLLDYVTCLVNDTTNPLKDVIVRFAAYPFPAGQDFDPTTDPAYQLTLIFSFRQVSEPLEGSNNNFTFQAEDRKKDNFTGGDTDTGNPCPPNTCDGSELPKP